MTSSRIGRDDWLGPWPLNLVGRQWRRGMRLSGGQRVLVVTGLGCEVAFVAAVVLLLII
jgi:hypothetical protein